MTEEAPKKRGRPPNEDVKIVWPNAWTSIGKRFEGDIVSVSAGEAENLCKCGAAERVSKPKASKNDD